MFLCERKFSFLWDKHPGLQLLDVSVFKKLQNRFPLAFSLAMHEWPARTRRGQIPHAVRRDRKLLRARWPATLIGVW